MRTVRWVAGVLALQAALVGVYLWVERDRASHDVASRGLGVAPGEPITAPLPKLTLTLRDGSRVALAPSGRPTLVHFWATWCPPCREELPALLRLPEARDVVLVAVALDEEWRTVERFFGESPPPSVVLADGREVTRKWGIPQLPATYLVDATGRLRLRFDGARDWSDAAFLSTWMGAVDDG